MKVNTSRTTAVNRKVFMVAKSEPLSKGHIITATDYNSGQFILL